MRWTLWAVVVAGAAATAVRLLAAGGLADHWTTVPVLGAYPWVVLATGVAAAIGGGILWARGARGLRGATAALVVAAAVGAAIVVPRTVARPQPAADGPEVTVAVINVRRGLASADRIAQIVENTGIDILVTIELTDGLDAELQRAGLAAALPQSVVSPTRATAGGGIYTTGTIAPLSPPAVSGDTPDVTITLAGGTKLQVTSTHPVPPIGPDRTQRWRDGLDRIGPPPDGQPALVVGDLNATLDHDTLRDVLDLGWRDAAREAGAGLSATYDGILDGSPGVPMALDHILVSPTIAVEDVRTYDVDGTDHRLLVADLTLPQ